MHETLPSAPSVKKGGTPNIAELGRSKRKTDDASGLDSTRFISKKAMSPHSFFGSFDTFPDSKRRMSLDIEYVEVHWFGHCRTGSSHELWLKDAHIF